MSSVKPANKYIFWNHTSGSYLNFDKNTRIQTYKRIPYIGIKFIQ